MIRRIADRHGGPWVWFAITTILVGVIVALVWTNEVQGETNKNTVDLHSLCLIVSDAAHLPLAPTTATSKPVTGLGLVADGYREFARLDCASHGYPALDKPDPRVAAILKAHP